jgi:type I restriction enzyme S subunit
MIMKYDSYKDSGIEWIGEVPEQWRVGRLRHFCSKITDGSHHSPPTVQNGKRYISVKDVIGDNIDFDHCKLISKEEFEVLARNGCQPEKGDILLTKDGTIGRACVVGYDTDFVVLSSLGIIRPTKTVLDSDFLKYFLVSSLNVDQMLSFIQGSALTRITISIIKSLFITVPPLSEQKAIAYFLNLKASQIDSLIQKKQQMIALLEEEKTAVINEAVTRGVNPDAPMKDSGIDWLGTIPAHWDLRKISRSFSLIGSGTTPESGNPLYHENGTIPWVNTGDLNDGVLSSVNKKITEQAFDKYSLRIYPKGSLVIAMYGATIGKVSILNLEACTNQACCVLGDSPVFSIDFVYYFFLANKQHIISLGYGGGQPNISQELLKGLIVPAPNKEEQHLVVSYLKKETSRIEGTANMLSKEISLLQEYRTALISDAVTGKIDVQDYQPEQTLSPVLTD